MKNTVLRHEKGTCPALTQSVSAGFSLIESIIYCALLAIILVALFEVSRSVQFAQWALSDKLAVQRDAIFIQKKIHWLLAHSESVQAPMESSSAQHLQLVIGDNGLHTVVIREDAGDLVLVRDGARSVLVPSNQNVKGFAVSRSTQKLTASFIIQNQSFVRDYETN